MAKGKLLLGLDIGSSSVKMCLLKDVRNTYEIDLIDREEIPSDAIVEGSILDRSSVSRKIRAMVARNKVRQ